jgi:hypothetical protein
MTYFGSCSDEVIEVMGDAEHLRECFPDDSVVYARGYRSRDTTHNNGSLFIAVVTPTVLELDEWRAMQCIVRAVVRTECPGLWQAPHVVESKWETAGLFNREACFEEHGGASSGSFEEVQAALGVRKLNWW